MNTALNPTTSFSRLRPRTANKSGWLQRTLFVVVAMAAPAVHAAITGSVFLDNNNNGTKDTTGGILEEGVCAATVTAYDDAGTAFGPVSTATDGSFTIPGTNAGTKYRVEVTGPTYGVWSGADAGSTRVSFVDGAASSVLLGLIHPERYWNNSSNPIPVFTLACYNNGDSQGGASTEGAIVEVKNDEDFVPADNVSPTLPHQMVATVGQVGATWGNAYDPIGDRFFYTALLKRHSGLGPKGAGGVYIAGLSSGHYTYAAGFTLEGVTPANGGSSLSFGTVTRTSTDSASDNYIAATTTEPCRDLDAYAKIARVGIGDCDWDPLTKKLFLVNVFENRLVSIDISGQANASLNNATAATLGPLVKAYTLGSISGYPTGTVKAWGLGFRNGKGFIGVTKEDATQAFVLRFDPANPAAGFTTITTVDLSYRGDWHAWNDNYLTTGGSTSDWIFSFYPQPVLSDIDFDDQNNMVISIFDRFGHQMGYGNFYPVAGLTTICNTGAYGDTLFACYNKTTQGWDIEGSSACPPNFTSVPNIWQSYGSIGGIPGEYFDDTAGDGSGDNGMGSAAIIPGSNRVAIIALDPIPAGATPGERFFSTGGVNWYDANTGARTQSSRLYNSSPTNLFGKAHGLGDIEFALPLAPIQIGNRVWSDANSNGIQDPSETPIGGVVVSLKNAAGTVISTATTDANGNYYFTNGAGTSTASSKFGIAGLTPNTTGYKVCIATTDAALAGKQATVATVDATTNGTERDSNGVVSGANVVATVDTLDYGLNNHSLDFGFTAQSCPTITVSSNPLSSGSVGAAYSGTPSTTGGTAPYTWAATALPTGLSISSSTGAVTGTPSATGTATITATDANGCKGTTTLTINPFSCPIITVTPSTLPGGMVGSAYNQTPTASGAPSGSTYTWSATGLPAGLSINASTGAITGTPTANGTATITATYTSAGTNCTGTTTLAVSSCPLYPAQDVTTTIDCSTPISKQLSVTGGTAPYTWTVTSGTLPKGLSLSSSGLLSGTTAATTGGLVTITAVDANACPGVLNLTIKINPCKAALGDFVWKDLDRDGVQDPGEPGIENVTVTLYDSTGTAVGTTTTNSLGFYHFTDLVPGTYSVGFPKQLPSATSGLCILTIKDSVTGTDSTDSDVDPTTGKTPPVVLVAGDNNLTIDAGYLSPKASLGDFVWKDLNRNGIQDANEPGIENVTVTLYGSDGTTAIGTTTTNAVGYYSFWDLDPGDYYVGVPATLPDGCKLGVKDKSTDDTKDSDGDPTTGKSPKVTLTQGQHDGTIDFGFISEKASLGDFVWKDLNRDGKQDPGEPGIEGVVVTLYDSAGTAIGTTTTNATGYYSFWNLAPGTYSVGVPTTLVDGCKLGVKDSPTDDTKDSDGDPTTGKSPPVTLVAGQNDPTIDFGFITDKASLGDYVWKDLNKDGKQDAGEPGIAGVQVTLLDSAGTAIGTTTTDATGYYHFVNLAPGTYSVSFPLNVGPGCTLTVKDSAVASDTTDSDADPVTGKTATTTLVAGQNYPDFDAGYISPKASLGNYVWKDLNKNGVQEANEPGIAGVTVTLYDSAGTAIGTTTTDGTGGYAFTDLAPGTYVVGVPVTLVDGCKLGVKDTPTDDTKDSDGDPTTGKSGPVVLTAGQNDPTIDFGFISPKATLGDYVWKDLNRNSLQDANEPGIANVTVTLYDSTGAKIGTTVTNGVGWYQFANLQPGTYSVGFPTLLPDGCIIVPNDQGTDDTKDSDASPTTGKTTSVTLAAGDSNQTVDAGYVSPKASLGDYVWKDLVKNGLQDAGEPGIGGVTVNLYNSLGTLIATTLTDSLGYYHFMNLDPGTYTVGFPTVINGGCVLVPATQGGDTAKDSNPDITAGKTTSITLIAGQNDPSIDAGYVSPLAALGDFVWKDLNKNGQQDAGEPGIENVTVTLLNSSGVAIGSTLTDSTGHYWFGNLQPGTYAVQFPLIVQNNCVLSAADTGADTSDSDANITTGKTVNVTLAAGETNPTIDAGYNSPLASLGDFVWKDTNKNGQQDAGEPGIANVTVNLLNSTGTVLGTTLTDSTGHYSFTNLQPGTYAVQFPAKVQGECVLTTKDTGADVSDSDADSTTGKTANVTLAPGENNPTIDAGYYSPLAALGNYVWKDLNRDGKQDVNEPGIANVRVTLLDGTGNVIGSTTTDGTGYYLFDRLQPGTYAVSFPKVLSDGCVLTTADNVPGDDTLDSDPSIATGKTINVTLAASEINLTIDAGYVSPKASLGDYVWKDLNKNGQQDAGEPGIEGVIVTLLNSTGTAIGTTTTNATGYYSFIDLAPGTYSVQFPIVIANGCVLTVADTGLDASDSDPNIATGKTIPVTLAAGQNNPTIDAGYVSPLASLGDYVWKDLNKNGQQDLGEPGIEGVTVVLLNSTGVAIGQTVTGPTGYYSFTDLQPGTYAVQFPTLIAANGCVLTTKDTGTDSSDSDADVASGKTTNVTLAAGENNPTIDAGYVSPKASLGDYVWKDINKNGQQDAGEPGILGVTVTLLNNSGVPVGSTVTDSNGYYSFTNLQPGTYAVQFPTKVQGECVLTTKDTGADATDSDPDPQTGKTINVTLAAGENNPTIDAGYYSPLASLGNYVWKDLNRDGKQDANEPGIANVPVGLLSSTGAPLSVTRTDGTGYYLFDRLQPGTYSVVFPRTLADGCVLTFADQAAGDDNLDSDPNITTGKTISVTLAASEVNLTVDAGYYSPKASLGDFVWKDLNRNGVQDAGEPGIENVVITLLNSSGTPIGTTTTNALGYYDFHDLMPGTYSVQFPTQIANGCVLTVADTGTDALDSDADKTTGKTIPITLVAGQNDPNWDAGYISPFASLGDYVFKDTNKNGQQDPGEGGIANVVVQLLNSAGTVIGTDVTDATGHYAFIDLQPGTYAVQFPPSLSNGLCTLTTPDTGADATDSDANATTGKTIPITLIAGQNDMTWDAGYIAPLASIGDIVWKDLNKNGIQDAGEPGIAGVKVNLLNSAGTVVGTQVTDGVGHYLFEGLQPGDYSLQFPLTLTDGCVLGAKDAGADDTKDSDVDPVTGKTIATTLSAGENDPTWDAGYFSPLASLGDRVWKDLNRDGVQDANEPGIANITVNLYDSTGKLIGTDVTDGDGYYWFANLKAGTYTVGFPAVIGTGCLLTTQDNATEATDSDADKLTGKTAPITLAAGESNPNVDAGYYSPFASLGDRVFKDLNRNGIQDAGEPGVANITVTLYNAAGVAVGTDVTDGNGYYLFTDLQPGDYSVGFPLAIGPGCVLTQADQGTDDTKDSDPSTTTGRTPLTTLVAGENDPTWDAGYISPFASLGDFVWKDLNRDGIQQAGEPGIANIVVTLYKADGTAVGHDTTDGNGYYSFTDLLPGDYYVQVALSTVDGCKLDTPDQGTDDAKDSDIDPTNGKSHVVTLKAGDNNPTLDVGYFSPKASIGDLVWKDKNRNGIQDPGEPGIANVRVELLDANGVSVGTDLTDGLGYFVFTDLNPGDYSLRFPITLMDGCSIAKADQGTDDAKDSDPNVTTGLTVKTTLTAGENDMTWDAGYAPIPMCLGDLVWLDQDHDGLQDGGEPGIQGAKVELFYSNGTPAKDIDGLAVAAQTTGNDGHYKFANLAPGDYVVRVTPPAGLKTTIGGVDPDNDNNKDSNAVELLGYNYVQSLPVTLLNNSEPVNDTDTDPNTNLTVDFGFYYPKYDLALRKLLAPGQRNPVKPGDKVTFTIEIFNQGDIAVHNTKVVDYVPAGLILDTVASPNWAMVGSNAEGLLYNEIKPGDSSTTTITFTIAATQAAGDIANYAEIFESLDPDGHAIADVDSTPDKDPTNDGVVFDNEINNENSDQDDHDGAIITVVPPGTWDLALRKTLAPGQNASVNPGDDVTFLLEVFNQGTDAAKNIKLVDYIPAGMTLADSQWAASGADKAVTTLANPLAAGASVQVTVTLHSSSALVGPKALTNYAEIADFKDINGIARTDIDSTPDMDNTNDGPLVDNAINNEQGDQDDHDLAVVNINAPKVFDLALRKQLAQGQSVTVSRDSVVNFVFEVFNQGAVPAKNIVVTDYLPSYFTLEDPNWVATLPGQIATSIPQIVAPGASVKLNLSVRLNSNAPVNTTLTCRAEISAATDDKGNAVVDRDSTMDNIPTNDGPATDDAINGENADEDDADFAVINVAPPGTFDLALRKTLAIGQSTTVNAGDSVNFVIEVFNQGTVAAKAIQVTDYIPSGFSLHDANWVLGANGYATGGLGASFTLAPGASVQLPITLMANTNAAAGDYRNVAEISGAKDINGNTPTDLDSVADGNPANDGFMKDDELNNGSFDEDDSDFAVVTVNLPARRDLALRKTLAAGQNYDVKPGDLVRFCIEVFNQGAVPAKDIVLCDYLPTGTFLAPVTENIGWRTLSTGIVQCPIAGPLLPGTSTKAYITLKMPSTGPQEVCNAAEICSAKNLDGTAFVDADSTFDSDPTNDGKVTDNAINNESFDQDDHDIECVRVGAPAEADLALRKTVASGQKPCIDEGQSITYNIEVFNQGALSLKDIKVCDYIPSGLDLVSTDWTLETSNRAVCTIRGPLDPGKSQSIQITLKAKPGSADSVQTNCAEICAASNLDGTPYKDRDSTPDNIATNDGRATNDAINNENFDEDDADCEDVKINPAPQRASLGDYVWIDLNGNGIQDPGEQPLQAVVVKLLDAGGAPVDNPNIVGIQPYEVLTDLTGHYLFDKLPAGNYVIEFAQPADMNRCSKDQGADDAKDNDADPITGRTGVVTLAAGQARTDVDACFSPAKTNWEAFLAGDPATNNSATADTDGDGYNSLAEFAFCLKPGSGVLDKCPITINKMSDGKLQVCVRRIEGGTGLTISLEQLADLSASPGGWTALLAPATTMVSNGDGTTNACWNDIESLTGLANGQGFIRAKVSLDTNGDHQADYTTVSEVVGWTRRTFLSQCETFSMPYLKCDGFRGMVSSATINSISVQNGGVAVTSSIKGGHEYFIEVLSGPYEGNRFEVDEAATTAGTFAIKLGGTRTTMTTVPTDLTGARVALREHWTVNDILPATNFRGTLSSTTGDRLMFYSGSGYDILWNVQNSTLDRWVSSSDATLADLGGRIIAPCEGFFVHPRNGSVNSVFYGAVRTNKFTCPLPSTGTFLGGGWPLNQSPNDRAMTTTNGFTGGGNAKAADQIRIWLGDSAFKQEGYLSHFLLKAGTLNQWTPESPATLANENDVKLFLSTHAAFMQLKNSNPSFTMPVPWQP